MKRLWPKARVEVVGSTGTGLCLPSSDLDITVLGNVSQTPITDLVGCLGRAHIAARDTLRTVMASVPLVRYVDAETKLDVVITVNRESSVRAVELIKVFMEEFESLAPLLTVLKLLLYQENLHSVYSGGVSPFALLLLTVSFLQSRRRSHRRTSLSHHLLNLFHYFSWEFDFFSFGICVTGEG